MAFKGNPFPLEDLRAPSFFGEYKTPPDCFGE